MFSKTVEYEDFDGNPRSETMYFNLTAPELAKLEFEFDGIEAYIKKSVEEKSNKRLYALFEFLISLSYGRRDAEGNGFRKKSEWLEELTCGMAYEALFLWLFTNEENMIAFYTDVMPKKLEEKLEKLGTNKAAAGEKPKKLSDMSKEELVALMQKRVAGE